MQEEMFNDSFAQNLSRETPLAIESPIHMATSITSETKEGLHAVGSDAIAAPRGWQVTVTPNHLVITRRTLRVGIFLFFVSAAGGIYLQVRHDLSGGGWSLLVFVLSLGIAVLVDKLLNERAVIEISRGRLRSTYRPIPWPNRSFKASDISQFYCVDVYHSGSKYSSGHYTYNVMLMTKQGRRRKVASGFDNKRDALALECMLENYLQIEDQSIAASFFEQNEGLLPMVIVLIAVGVTSLTLYIIFKPYSIVQTPTLTVAESSRLEQKAFDEYMAKTKSEIARQEMLQLSGDPWISRRVVHDRPEEMLFEFGSDGSGSIQIKSGTETMVDTQMTYAMLPNQVRIALPDGSNLVAGFSLNPEETQADITFKSANGWLAKKIGYFLLFNGPVVLQR